MEPTAPYTNQQAPSKPLPIQGLLVIAIVVLIAIIGFKTAWALNIRNKTGILEVSSPADTSLSISAQNNGASSIGLGTAKVRLTPGTYLILGVKNGEHGTAVVTVAKGQVTRTTVEPRGNGAASVESISFKGASGLINVGLSTDQVEQIAQDVFHFNPKATTAIINQSSITPAPHDPNTDIGFSVSFTIAIDGTNYAAVASYTDINTVTLQLSNPSTSNVLYDSSTEQQAGGD